MCGSPVDEQQRDGTTSFINTYNSVLLSCLMHFSSWTNRKNNVTPDCAQLAPQPTSRRPKYQLKVISNVETSYFTQLEMCYLMTTFRCPSDILITSWLFTAWWNTWPGNHLVPCVAELVLKWSGNSKPRFRINAYSDPDVCRIAPKMLWIHYLVGVSHFAVSLKSADVCVRKMLINLLKSSISRSAMMTEVGKWSGIRIRDRSPPKANQFFQSADPTLRSSNGALRVIPFVRSDFASNAFSVSSPTLWNNLPQDVRSCANQATFKSVDYFAVILHTDKQNERLAERLTDKPTRSNNLCP